MIFSPRHLFRLSGLALCTFIVLISCKSTPESSDKESEGGNEANIVQLDPTDSAYQRQLQNVKDSLGYFIALLKAKNENHFDFFAKAAFTEGDKAEHMWFSADSLVGNKVVGLLDNEPVELKNVIYKDPVKIDLGLIEDWAIYDKDSLVAGNFITYE
ncbi:DUF2314 domain-containing protein [Niabella hibiscisoli]|uniref:DUF2314 domain-containing protein n=1 Tax=Niabella hibiscisoli TaxID=1825928 RepID=UPI001F10AA47|nr:DUF2314 domain-containing protein [Niabella hibiscisoli]MCH5716002.1 DUF2314 domain-containing protein [Niabella hibiscisoli]